MKHLSLWALGPNSCVFNVIFNSAIFYMSQLLFSSYSKWQKPECDVIVVIKISSLFLPPLGLDNAAHLRVHPGDRAVGRNYEVIKPRRCLCLAFSGSKDHVTSLFNILMET